MDSSTKDGSSYLDGVPLKISPKFYPPRQVALPLSLDTKTSSDLLSEQYDFSLERSVIDFIEKRQAELAERPEEKASEDPPESDRLKAERRIPPWQSDSSILQPQQPLDPEVTGAAGHPRDDVKINLSDFENDTSSPFDYMELQTINDLEELNSVFQGIHNRDSDDRTTVQEDDPNGDAIPNVAKSVSFPLPRNNLYATGLGTIPSSLSEDFSSGGKSVPSNGSTNISRFASTFTEGGFSCDIPSLSQVPYVSSNAASQSTRGTTSSLRGCKSYSDISDLSDAEVPPLVKERSRTPPTVHPQVSEKEVQPLPLNEDYFGKESGEGVCDTSAYEELDETSRHFVDCITEMGFVKGQVARAVKHLGMDEKKVVEHLCQIQMLEESGYESSEAEAALHLHDYNRDQAKAFLDLVIRFQDLGFEKDAVKKALVQNKNDWNKTIDALLP